MQELEENFKKNGGSFEKYKIKTLFNIKPTSGYSITNDKLSADKGKNPVVTNSELNLGRTIFSNFPTTESNIITFSDTGTKSPNTFFFQEGDFIGYSHVQGMYPLTDAEKWQKYACMYIIPLLKKQSFGTYDYSTKMTRNIVGNFTVILPVKCGAIAFDYMENYVKELEQCYIRDLDAYLKVTGLDNYELTEEEKESLTKDYTFQTKRLENLFTIHSSKKKFNANSIKLDGGYPYVVRTAENNGIKGYTNQNPDYLNPGNTISLGQDTATMFYQEKPYFTGDKIKIVEPLAFVLTDKIALYLISCFNKTLSTFQWGQTSFNEEKLKKILINVPMIDSQIDIKYMETYIRAIEKLVIKDLVDWKNKEIETAKEVVNN